jgi:hypothetical protein
MKNQNDILVRLTNLSEAMRNGIPFNDGAFLEIESAIQEIESLRELNEDLHIQLSFYKEKEEADWNNKSWRMSDGESFDGKLE